jgi:hypothetical protein
VLAVFAVVVACQTYDRDQSREDRRYAREEVRDQQRYASRVAWYWKEYGDPERDGPQGKTLVLVVQNRAPVPLTEVRMVASRAREIVKLDQYAPEFKGDELYFRLELIPPCVVQTYNVHVAGNDPVARKPVGRELVAPRDGGARWKLRFRDGTAQGWARGLSDLTVDNVPPEQFRALAGKVGTAILDPGLSVQATDCSEGR